MNNTYTFRLLDIVVVFFFINFLLGITYFFSLISIGSYVSVPIFLVCILLFFFKKYIGVNHNKTIPFHAFFLIITCLILYDVGMRYVELTSISGAWDAWAMWNMKSKFLQNEDYWLNFSHEIIKWNSPDYPLLLPSINAFWMQLIGNHFSIPVYVHFFICICYFLLLLSVHSGWRMLFGIFLCWYLMKSDWFWHYATLQYADILLGVIYGLSLLMIQQYKIQNRKIDFVLSHFFAASTICIKNEGIIFFLIWVAFYGIQYYKEWKLILLGTLFPITFYLIFKIFFAPKGYLGEHLSINLLQNFTKIERVEQVILFVKDQLNNKFSFLCVYVIFGVLFSIKNTFKRKIFLFTLLVFTGYLSIYICFDFNLEWQLKTSMDRLLLQLVIMCMVVFLIFFKSERNERFNIFIKT